MAIQNRRTDPLPDRRRLPRGGRRPTDAGGRYHAPLVADSCDEVRRPFIRYLTRYGFHVEEAVNGGELQKAVQTMRPQVILTEIGLPHMGAARLSEWLADADNMRRIPVIVMADEFSEDV